MPLTPLQDRVEGLLSRQLVESKIRGGAPSDYEAAAVVETVALNLFLNPRSVLYVAHLARNSLAAVVSSELATISELKSAISDMANPDFTVRDVTALKRARAALLQIEGHGRLVLGGGPWKNYDASINEFLNKQLAKSVRRPGASAMVRPGSEAGQSLPGTFSSLRTVHADLLSRLDALISGVPAFMASDYHTLLGVTTAFRARQDIDSIMSDIEYGAGGEAARDQVHRLIAGRASLRVVGSAPDPFGPKLSTSAKLPDGNVIKARTLPSEPVIESMPGPWVAPSELTVWLNGVAHTSQFPLTTAVLGNEAIIVGKPLAYPVTVPANYSLFLGIDGTDLRVPLTDGLNPETFATEAALLLKLNSGLGALAAAVSYHPGTSRIAIIAAAGTSSMSIKLEVVEPHPGSTIGEASRYVNSAHAYLGFEETSSGTGGTTPSFVVADGFNEIFGEYVTATVQEDDSIRLVGRSGTVTSLQVTSPSTILGFPTVVTYGRTDSIQLYGVIGSENIDPIEAATQLDVSDLVTSHNVKVSDLKGTVAVLSAPVESFDGSIVVTSALTSMWEGLSSALGSFMEGWRGSGYAKDLSRLDAFIAPLYGSPTPARRNAAIAALVVLEGHLVALKSALSSYPLPAGSATTERLVVADILQTLKERKYDRAVDLLLRCRIQEIFSLDWQTASYGGELMSAATAVSQLDIHWPNRGKDEGMTPVAVERAGTNGV